MGFPARRTSKIFALFRAEFLTLFHFSKNSPSHVQVAEAGFAPL
jgi:hypothetical protein